MNGRRESNRNIEFQVHQNKKKKNKLRKTRANPLTFSINSSMGSAEIVASLWPSINEEEEHMFVPIPRRLPVL